MPRHSEEQENALSAWCGIRYTLSWGTVGFGFFAPSRASETRKEPEMSDRTRKGESAMATKVKVAAEGVRQSYPHGLVYGITGNRICE